MKIVQFVNWQKLSFNIIKILIYIRLIINITIKRYFSVHNCFFAHYFSDLA